MKYIISLLILSMAPMHAIANSDIIYLKCRYSDGDVKYPKERNIIMTIDPTKHVLIFEDFYTTGSNKKVYKLNKLLKDKILASKKEEAGDWELEINRISGNWLVKAPADKSQNKNIWNDKEKKMGYPEDAQVIMTFGGLCVPAKPSF